MNSLSGTDAGNMTSLVIMLVGALIAAVIILVFVFKTGGTAAKSGGLHAELLGAETGGSIPANSIAVATNIQLPNISSSGTGTIYINGNSISGTLSMTPMYLVSGGYEYQISGVTPSMPNTLTSLTYTDSVGGNIVILPASGTSVSVVPNGSFPFSIRGS